MRKIVFLFLIINSVCSLAQEKLKFNNYWVEELGKDMIRSRVIEVYKKNGAEIKSVNNSDDFVVFYPQSSLAIEFRGNRVNDSAKPWLVFWGTSEEFKKRYHTLETNKIIRTNGGDGVLGLKVGTRLSDIEQRTGRKLGLVRNTEGERDIRRFPWLPIIGNMDLQLLFQNDRIVSIIAAINSPFRYQQNIRGVQSVSYVGYPEVFRKYLNLESKISYGIISAATSGVADLYIKKGKVFDANELKKLARAEEVKAILNDRTRFVWCVQNLGSRNEIKEYILANLNAMKSSGIEPFNSTSKVEIGAYDQLFVDHADVQTYQSKRQKPVYHLYQLEGAKEVVLEVIYPSSNDLKTKFFNTCNLTDTAGIADDERLSKVAESLKAKFSKYSGMDWYTFLGAPSRSQINGKSYRQQGVYPMTKENKTTREYYVSELKFALDLKGNSFEGVTPFGLEKNMKMGKIKEVIPNFRYSSSDTKQKQTSIYTTFQWTKDVSLKLGLKFAKNKLKTIVIWVDGATSPQWLKSKNEVLLNGRD